MGINTDIKGIMEPWTFRSEANKKKKKNTSVSLDLLVAEA